MQVNLLTFTGFYARLLALICDGFALARARRAACARAAAGAIALGSCSPWGARRRGGRAAEGARLESVYAGNRIAGSNPAPSATFRDKPLTPQTIMFASSSSDDGALQFGPVATVTLTSR